MHASVQLKPTIYNMAPQYIYDQQGCDNLLTTLLKPVWTCIEVPYYEQFTV